MCRRQNDWQRPKTSQNKVKFEENLKVKITTGKARKEKNIKEILFDKFFAFHWLSSLVSDEFIEWKRWTRAWVQLRKETGCQSWRVIERWFEEQIFWYCGSVTTKTRKIWEFEFCRLKAWKLTLKGLKIWRTSSTGKIDFFVKKGKKS